jgi:hypothetical protein
VIGILCSASAWEMANILVRQEVPTASARPEGSTAARC